jgi:hypothetical protein
MQEDIRQGAGTKLIVRKYMEVIGTEFRGFICNGKLNAVTL